MLGPLGFTNSCQVDLMHTQVQNHVSVWTQLFHSDLKTLRTCWFFCTRAEVPLDWSFLSGVRMVSMPGENRLMLLVGLGVYWEVSLWNPRSGLQVILLGWWRRQQTPNICCHSDRCPRLSPFFGSLHQINSQNAYEVMRHKIITS